MLRSTALRRSFAAVSVVMGLAVGVVGCGDDAADGTSPSLSAPTSSTSSSTASSATGPSTTTGGAGGVEGDLLAAAGGAVAAQGARLDEPPGPADRVRIGELGEVAIAITAPDGTVTGWCVLLAADEARRQRGLMEVTDLQGYAGMLFVWNTDVSSSFWMRNTPMPLSIAWIDAGGELVSAEDMAPCDDVDDCPLYSPGGSYRFALEVPQGELEGMGLVEGSTLAVGGSCAPPTDTG